MSHKAVTPDVGFAEGSSSQKADRSLDVELILLFSYVFFYRRPPLEK